MNEICYSIVSSCSVRTVLLLVTIRAISTLPNTLPAHPSFENTPQLTRVINPQKGVRVHIRQHSQRLLLIRQQRSTENVTQPFVNRASAPDPSWSLQRSPDPLSGTQGACCPLPKNSARAVSPLDLITSSPLFSGTPVSFFYKPRRTRLSTIGDRAFPVAAARVWNGLPHHVTSAPSLAVFRSRLKTHLFRRCFP